MRIKVDEDLPREVVELLGASNQVSEGGVGHATNPEESHNRRNDAARCGPD
jgi:hypothetical protein